MQGRAREAERELASLSYSVSHDLRAPLRGIDGFSQALTEDYGHRLDATAHDYLRRVRANAAHMNALIDDLLSLARVVRAPFRAEPVDVSALARDIARALTASEPTCAWCDGRSRRTSSPSPTGNCSRKRLRQLLANAWKFTSARDVAQVSFHVLPPDPEHPAGAVYQVRDNGVGFRHAVRRVGLFGAFQRMHTRRRSFLPDAASVWRWSSGSSTATAARCGRRLLPNTARGSRSRSKGAPIGPAADDVSALGGLATLRRRPGRRAP